MIAFPQSAAFGRRIAVAELKRQGLKPRLAEGVKSLVWAYKLAPATVQLAATEQVKEIEVMDLSVKPAMQSLRARSLVMEALNALIPNPCIFRVTDDDGIHIETAVYPKASGGALHGESAVFRYARRGPSMDGRAQDEWPSGVTTLESLLIHLAAQLAGMAVRPGESLKDFDARHYRLEALREERERLEKRLRKETQVSVRFELHQQFQQVEKEMASCLNT